MLRAVSLSLSLRGVAAVALSNGALLSVAAQEDGSADQLCVMSISLKDVVKPTLGFEGALQRGGTPNQEGIGEFLRLSIGKNSVWFLDVLVNVELRSATTQRIRS